MDKFVLANRTNLDRDSNVFQSLRAAKISLAALVRKGNFRGFEVMTLDEFWALDGTVEVINLVSGLPVIIRKSEVGGCCDPSTETYWSM